MHMIAFSYPARAVALQERWAPISSTPAHKVQNFPIVLFVSTPPFHPSITDSRKLLGESPDRSSSRNVLYCQSLCTGQEIKKTIWASNNRFFHRLTLKPTFSTIGVTTTQISVTLTPVMNMSLLEERECTSYEDSISEGAFKTRNLTPDQVQRLTITDRGRESYFKASVCIISCVHGHLEIVDENPTRPATLLVLEYRLNPKPGHHFSDVYTSFVFDNQKPTNNSVVAIETPAASPNVFAFAPFQRPYRFGQTPSEVTTNRRAHGTLGVQAGPATLEGGGELGVEETHVQQHFAKGTADKHYNEKTGLNDTVWWRLEENRSQKHGVLEVFRVAVLIERASHADFVGTFRMDIHGSFLYRIQQLGGDAERFFRRLPLDDPVNFSPIKMPLQGHVDKDLVVDELGKLVRDSIDGKRLELPESYHVYGFLPD